MKIQVLKKDLQLCLNNIQKAIPSKPQLPILSSILLETTEKQLVLSATDLYLGIKTKTFAKIENQGKIAVPGNIFKKIISSLNPGSITLELKNNFLLVSSNKSEVKISTQGADDYPNFPKIESGVLPIPLELIQNIEKYISFSVSLDQTRPILTSLLFNFNSDGLGVVSTDSFRLAVLNSSQSLSEKDLKFLLPGSVIGEISRIAKQAAVKDVAMQISFELKQVKFHINDTEIYARLIDGEFPPYQKIIPASFLTELEVDGQLLTEEVKRAAVLCQDSSKIVRFLIKKNGIEIISSSATHGEYKGFIEVVVTGQIDQEVAFNVKYLLDFLNSVKPEKVYFGMNESLKPTMFKVDDNKDFFYVVMPFRVNN